MRLVPYNTLDRPLEPRRSSRNTKLEKPNGESSNSQTAALAAAREEAQTKLSKAEFRRAEVTQGFKGLRFQQAASARTPRVQFRIAQENSLSLSLSLSSCATRSQVGAAALCGLTLFDAIGLDDFDLLGCAAAAGYMLVNLPPTSTASKA